MSGIRAKPDGTIDVYLREMELWHIGIMAELATIGGFSKVRGQGVERQVTKNEDNWSGQIGEAALHKYWNGGLTSYTVHRWYQNKTPYAGDKGYDLAACNVDVKCSKWRDMTKKARTFNLLVSEREYYDNWVYILALWKHGENNKGIIVNMVGWATTKELQRNQSDFFKAEWYLPASKLHPLPPLRWLWVPEVEDNK